MLLFVLALLNRTGSLVLFWKEEPTGSLTHDAGNGYYAFVRDDNIRALDLPFFLKEDENIVPPQPLSVNEDITASIKEEGGGAYQLLDNGDLYLSAADGHPEDHEYSIISPSVIRNRWLLALFIPAVLSAAAVLWLLLKYKETRALEDLTARMTAVFFLLLLLPWNRMIFPAAPARIAGVLFKPVLQRNVWFIGVFGLLLLLCHFLKTKIRYLNLLAVLIILCNTVYYFIPEWNYYGRRADSGAYLQKYSASSIRTPGYPVFIDAVYAVTGSGGLDALREEGETAPDERLWDGASADSRGLLNVARAQKIVLGAAFIAFFAVYCLYYAPAWFIFAAQIILCCGFLGTDNSYIMSECLSQAALIPAAAAFLALFKDRKPAVFPVLCVLSACAVLIRPANIFVIMPVLAGAFLLIRRKGGLPMLLTGGFLFIALSAVPALTILLDRGIFVWMPTSGYVEMARAVDLIRPGDEEAFADEELKEFCTLLLDKKQQYPDGDASTYTWQVALASAEEMGYDRISCSPLFGKFSRKVFRMYFGEFVSSLLGTIRTALERTRLRFGPLTFPVLAALFTVLFAVRVNTDSLTGLILMLMHCAHLCISMMNQPERRYIYSTEILCIFGWLLIWTAFITSLKRNKN